MGTPTLCGIHISQNSENNYEYLMNFFKLLVKKDTLQGGKNKLCVKIFKLKYLCVSLLKIKIGYSPLEKFVLHLINLPGSLVPKEAYIE